MKHRLCHRSYEGFWDYYHCRQRSAMKSSFSCWSSVLSLIQSRRYTSLCDFGRLDQLLGQTVRPTHIVLSFVHYWNCLLFRCHWTQTLCLFLGLVPKFDAFLPSQWSVCHGWQKQCPKVTIAFKFPRTYFLLYRILFLLFRWRLKLLCARGWSLELRGF